MMLCDTGPIVGMIVEEDQHHLQCTEIAQRLAEDELVTTVACVTESMHLLKRAGGWAAQEQLWGLIESGAILVHQLSLTANQRLAQLMRKYHDAPMDFADATLVAAAEELNLRRIFTLDSHFRTYLIHDHIPFVVVQ